MAANNTPTEKPPAKPKRPTENDQIAELREQIAALTQALKPVTVPELTASLTGTPGHAINGPCETGLAFRILGFHSG